LDNKPFFTLQERADYIRKRLESKAENLVLWNKEEIEEMSDRFQKTIEARQALQTIMLERLWFAQELQFRAEDFPG
jgi:tRNA U34 5-carboxymethylaminomethyl modifying enzyme MnmG/GidA